MICVPTVRNFLKFEGTRTVGQRERRAKGTAGEGNGRTPIQHWTSSKDGENAEKGGTEEWESGCAEGQAGGRWKEKRNIHSSMGVKLIKYLLYNNCL